jgi:hypothetical protein
MGGANYGGGSGGTYPSMYLRNNIIHTTQYTFAVDFPGMWNEDYNDFSTTDTTRGMKYNGLRYSTDVAGYRAASLQGAHSNLSNNFITTLPLNNPVAGDLSLPTGSPLVDAGVLVPNIADLAGVNYNGAAPDMGANEY